MELLIQIIIFQYLLINTGFEISFNIFKISLVSHFCRFIHLQQYWRCSSCVRNNYIHVSILFDYKHVCVLFTCKIFCFVNICLYLVIPYNFFYFFSHPPSYNFYPSTLGLPHDFLTSPIKVIFGLTTFLVFIPFHFLTSYNTFSLESCYFLDLYKNISLQPIKIGQLLSVNYICTTY